MPGVAAVDVRKLSVASSKLVPIPTLPPIFTEPPSPTPPDTINDPVVVDVEGVPDVTAKPDALNMSVEGLYTNEDSVDQAIPEPAAFGLKIK